MSRGANVRVAVLLVVLLATDLIPHHGSPSFRYPGSDPAVPVWNIGWPLATAIYDARSGWHFGLLPFIALAQAFLVAAWIVGEWVVATARAWFPRKPSAKKAPDLLQ